MNASSVNWKNKIHVITLHKKNLTIFFFNEILDWEIFQAILRKFRGNSEWDWGQFRPQFGSKKNTVLETEFSIKSSQSGRGISGMDTPSKFFRLHNIRALKKSPLHQPEKKI